MFDLHKKSHPNDEIVGWLVNFVNKILICNCILQRESLHLSLYLSVEAYKACPYLLLP